MYQQKELKNTLYYQNKKSAVAEIIVISDFLYQKGRLTER